MRGWWRPFVVYLGLVVGLVAAVSLVAGPRGPQTLVVLAIVAAVVAPFVGLLLLRTWVPPARFLAGMREAGLAPERVDDEVSWLGDRRVRVRTFQGEWTVATEGGPKYMRLLVTAPARRPAAVRGSARRAGREAMARFLAPAVPEAPRTVRPLSEGTRRLVAGAFLVGGPLLALAPLWTLRDPGTPWRDLWWTVHWIGVGMTTFVVFVGVAAHVWRRTEHRSAGMGRRWAAAVMLLGLGAGLESTALLAALAGAVTGGPVLGLFYGVALALAAALFASLALETDRAPTRLVLTLGAGAAAGASWFQAHPAITAGGALFVVYVLVQTWTTAPPTAPDAASD